MVRHSVELNKHEEEALQRLKAKFETRTIVATIRKAILLCDYMVRRGKDEKA